MTETVTIQNCRFEYVCPRDWDKLQQDPVFSKVKHCEGCRKPVYLCTNNEELIDHIRRGDCVAVHQMDPISGENDRYFGHPEPLTTYQASGSISWD